MSNPPNEPMTYEEARERYRNLLRRYADALKLKTGGAEQLFAEAQRAWLVTASLARPGTPEAGAGAEAHSFLAFSHAVAAGDKEEARRVYHLLSEEDRSVVDEQDRDVPGSLKTWQVPD